MKIKKLVKKVIRKIVSIHKCLVWLEKERINAMVHCGKPFV